MDRDGWIYIIPGEASAIMDTILDRQMAVAEADSGAQVAFPLKDSAEVSAGITVEIETTELYPKTYVVLVKDLYGYFSESMSVHLRLDPTGLDDPAESFSKIYPNPAGNFLNIEMESAGPYRVDILSLTGKLLSGVQMDRTTHQFDLSSFRDGVYFITVRLKDFVITRKVIKL